MTTAYSTTWAQLSIWPSQSSPRNVLVCDNEETCNFVHVVPEVGHKIFGIKYDGKKVCSVKMDHEVPQILCVGTSAKDAAKDVHVLQC